MSDSKPSWIRTLRGRWSSTSSKRPSSWPELEAWTLARGWRFKLAKQLDGFVIEPDGADWRLEWGPSSRSYLGTHELRLRGDTGMGPGCFAVLMPKSLLDTLERALFDEYVDGVQTRTDSRTPEEVRWLAVAPRLGSDDLGALKEQVAVVANMLPWMRRWLAGATGRVLDEMLANRPLNGGEPFAMILRQGGMILRMSAPVPSGPALTEAMGLFETARACAKQLAADPETAASSP